MRQLKIRILKQRSIAYQLNNREKNHLINELHVYANNYVNTHQILNHVI